MYKYIYLNFSLTNLCGCALRSKGKYT